MKVHLLLGPFLEDAGGVAKRIDRNAEERLAEPLRPVILFATRRPRTEWVAGQPMYEQDIKNCRTTAADLCYLRSFAHRVESVPSLSLRSGPRGLSTSSGPRRYRNRVSFDASSHELPATHPGAVMD